MLLAGRSCGCTWYLEESVEECSYFILRCSLTGVVYVKVPLRPSVSKEVCSVVQDLDTEVISHFLLGDDREGEKVEDVSRLLQGTFLAPPSPLYKRKHGEHLQAVGTRCGPGAHSVDVLWRCIPDTCTKAIEIDFFRGKRQPCQLIIVDDEIIVHWQSRVFARIYRADKQLCFTWFEQEVFVLDREDIWVLRLGHRTPCESDSEVS